MVVIKEEFEQVEYIQDVGIEKKGEGIKPVKKKRLKYILDRWSVVVSVKEVD